MSAIILYQVCTYKNSGIIYTKAHDSIYEATMDALNHQHTDTDCIKVIQANDPNKIYLIIEPKNQPSLYYRHHDPKTTDIMRAIWDYTENQQSPYAYYLASITNSLTNKTYPIKTDQKELDRKTAVSLLYASRHIDGITMKQFSQNLSNLKRISIHEADSVYLAQEYTVCKQTKYGNIWVRPEGKLQRVVSVPGKKVKLTVPGNLESRDPEQTELDITYHIASALSELICKPKSSITWYDLFAYLHDNPDGFPDIYGIACELVQDVPELCYAPGDRMLDSDY